MCLLYKSNLKVSDSAKCYLLRENLNAVKGGKIIKLDTYKNDTMSTMKVHAIFTTKFTIGFLTVCLVSNYQISCSWRNYIFNVTKRLKKQSNIFQQNTGFIILTHQIVDGQILRVCDNIL